MNDSIIYVFAKWLVAEGQLDTVLAYLPELAAKSTAEPGNLYYTVFQDRSEPGSLMLSEAYRDEAALTAHRNSAHYQEIVVARILPLLQDRQLMLSHQVVL